MGLKDLFSAFVLLLLLGREVFSLRNCVSNQVLHHHYECLFMR